MQSRVYNTLTRRKEPYQPGPDNHVRIYACGVTPYAEAHIGHARPALLWSVVKKYLEWRGYRVTLVQNFTDVDDKIIDRARSLGMDPLELARHYSERYLASMDALGIARADVYPRVTEHMDEIIEMIRGLVDKGFAYAVDGDVFYDVTRFPEYGKLSGQRLEELAAGTRFEVDERKRNPMDFALWKAAKPGEPAWPSPWGPGRPGWHIECSAMSLKYLGNGFEFHGGGTDLIFPHHENEIAQSEAYTGRAPFVRFWVHNGLVNMKDEKMSKSLGNFVTVEQVLEEYPAAAVRFFLLATHYRTPLEFSRRSLDDSRRGWQRLNGSVRELRDLAGGHGGDGAAPDLDALAQDERLTASGRRLAEAARTARQRFAEAMADDFNTAVAIAALFDLVRDANAFRQEVVGRGGPSPQELPVLAAVLRTFEELAGGILGILDLTEPAAQADGSLVDGLLDLLIQMRQEARAQKNWAAADRIRDGLGDLGIVLEDTPAGTRWKRAEEP